MLGVFNTASTADIEKLSSFNKHVICWYDVSDGRMPWIFSGYPDCNGNIIGRLTIRYGEKTMDAKKELSPPIIIRWSKIQHRT